MKVNKLAPAALLMLCLSIIFILTSIVFAAEETYPLPSDAILKLERVAPVGPSSATIRTYSTMLNKQQIQNFFRKELLKIGWEEKYKGGVAFVKGDKIISVMVINGKPRPTDEKTYFTLAISTKISDEMMQATAKDKPDKLNFMPVYPNAKQAVLWDTATGVMGSYTTTDSINDVFAFFKNKMPAYGWEIFQEKPVALKVFDCPDCEKKIKSLSGSKPEATPTKGKLYTADLKYRRSGTQMCSISFTSSDYKEASVSPEAKSAGILLPETKTQITVSYRDMKDVQ